MVRESLAHFLRIAGIGAVHAAPSAPAAIAAIRAVPPDFVVTDMQMGGDSRAGLAVVDAATSFGVPVIVVSGSADDPSLWARLTLTPMFSKGDLSPDRLLSLIDSALAGRVARPVSSCGASR